jgi:hypothetical protein
MELRDKMKHLERAEEAEMTVLVCGECGEEMRVAPSTDLEYIAYLWTLESGAKAYQPTPRDVFVVVNHPHGVEGLIDKRTGERWLERLENGGTPWQLTGTG